MSLVSVCEKKARHPVSVTDRVSLQRPTEVGSCGGMELLYDFHRGGRSWSKALVHTNLQGTVACKAAHQDAEDKQSHSQEPSGFFQEIGGALDPSDLACTLESGGKSSSFGVLDQNHCPQKEADNQDDDGQKYNHVQLFKSFAAFSAGPQNKHFLPGISKPKACKPFLPATFGPVGHTIWPWFL